MQSGKIKHWNQEKGYGFIEVDEQSEDVFFHISKARLAAPITVGQPVLFNSTRNDKNQLRATEVTSSTLSMTQDDATKTSQQPPHNTHQNTQNRPDSKPTLHSDHYSQRSHQNKRSIGSTLFSLLAILAIAFYFFGDLQSILSTNSAEPTTITQSSSEHSTSASTATAGLTGDAQIDQTLTLIKQGGPFPYPNKDGTTFYNREGRLPTESKGYYREYTVPTPGVSHRGARRIVTGGYPPTVYYLTVDHYESFRRLEVN